MEQLNPARTDVVADGSVACRHAASCSACTHPLHPVQFQCKQAGEVGTTPLSLMALLPDVPFVSHVVAVNHCIHEVRLVCVV